MASVTLKKIPPKDFEHIQNVQHDEKIKKKIGSYSKESAILKIIKEHREFTEKKNQ